MKMVRVRCCDNRPVHSMEPRMIESLVQGGNSVNDSSLMNDQTSGLLGRGAKFFDNVVLLGYCFGTVSYRLEFSLLRSSMELDLNL
jgi:hypothetical protein